MVSKTAADLRCARHRAFQHDCSACCAKRGYIPREIADRLRLSRVAKVTAQILGGAA